MDSLFFAVPVLGVLGLLFALFQGQKILKEDSGNERMKEIAKAIAEGAEAFLFAEYRILLFFVCSLFLCIGFGTKSWLSAVAFIFGALLSTLAGYFGMRSATAANVRTAEAARQYGMKKALSIAFSGGSVMGMCVAGFGIFGIGLFYMLTKDVGVLSGFSLGASSIALFARVGGGIYTKAADVGADLVGKVEAGIPEDVGDNVGDVAGMGADLFESYVGALVSAMTLGFLLEGKSIEGVAFPLLLAGLSLLACVLGSILVLTLGGDNPSKVLKMASYSSAAAVLIFAFALSQYFFRDLHAAFAVTAGLIAGLAIGAVTEYYTSSSYNPVKEIAKQSETGPATNIISGMAIGMRSTAIPIVLISVAIFISYSVLGLYGIALAAVGMLSTTAITVAVDAYGPIADNAGGIAEMSGLPEEVRCITDQLDAVGNTTAARGKGFAIGSAALTALALFASYAQAVGLNNINVLDSRVCIGLFIGAMLPFLFSAFTMSSVSKAAFSMISEVRRQFREKPGIMEGTEKPDYKTCVSISTKAALREMIVPGVLAVLAPLGIGLLLGAESLGGLLAGALVSGVMMAIFMSNSGGAWDNAKKYVEEGHNGGKGSDTHKAAVVGDTVGDPFKDTSGPSINILIKLMTVIALVFAPLIVAVGGIL